MSSKRTMVNAEEHLVGHYEALGDFKSDFRNYNLFGLVAGLVTGKKVLDIGCGVGNFLSVLRSQGPDVVGVEPSDGMRELAAKINPEITIFKDLNMIRDVFDTVTMLDVLEHIEDDRKQMQEVYSMLNNGGQFVIVVPAHPILYGKRDKEMGHFRRYTRESLTKVLTDNGFEVRLIRSWNALGFMPYLISEKVLKKSLESKMRRKKNKLMNFWFEKIENNFDFGFGLSIICVAKKNG